MRATILLQATILLFSASLSAEEPAPPPPAPLSEAQAFLKDAQAKHLDLAAAGLKSFSAKMRLEAASTMEGEAVKDQAVFGYSWVAPEQEDFVLDDVPEALRKGLADANRTIWRDLTGALFFGMFSAAAKLKLEKVPEGTVISGDFGEHGGFRALFDGGSSRLMRVDLSKYGAAYVYTLALEQGRFRVASKEVVDKSGKAHMKHTYSGHRKFKDFLLPTRFTVEAAKASYRFAIDYIMINDAPAAPAAVDPEVVKARIKEIEKGWAKLSVEDKKARLAQLSELEHDLASDAMVRLGLRDASYPVRREAAKLLGSMGRRNVVPALVAAMKANEKEIETYAAVIGALGDIGDPRAVDVLSKDWWNQQEAEYGVAAAKLKIRALGKIRDRSAVDALIDTFFLTRDDTMSQFKGDIHASLVKLTGQDFLLDRKAWKEWWKANRETFSFN